MKKIRLSAGLVVAAALLANACRDSSAPAEECGTSGQDCAHGSPCCPGFECDAQSGRCVVPSWCVAASGSCAGGETCCSGTLCMGDTCTACSGDLLCIESRAICQFSEQCCGGTSCQPDGGGALRCATCRPDGAECSGEGDRTCCAGMACTPLGGSGAYACLAPCGVGYECCFPGGEPCISGSQCCSGICGGGQCRASTCRPMGDPCTVTTDCCLGGCQVLAGETAGTCGCSADW